MKGKPPALVLTCLRRLTHAVAGVALGLAASVHAESITFHYGGTLTSVNPGLSAFFSEGDSFSGSYTFDSGAVDVVPHLDIGGYNAISATVAVGGITFGSSPGATGISIANSFVDGYNAGGGLLSDASLSDVQWNIGLVDLSGSAFSSDSLPLTLPGLSAFSMANFFLSARVTGNDSVIFLGAVGRLDNLSLTSPIPEPEIYAMLGIGLGVLGWVGRRRKLGERTAA